MGYFIYKYEMCWIPEYSKFFEITKILINPPFVLRIREEK